jgi:ABC-type spermidine/putrescine transport system permease subunit II
MTTLLNIALAVAMLSVVGVLFMGIYAMGRGGEFNRKYGNLLMRWRIIMQLVAVGIMLLIFWINKG